MDLNEVPIFYSAKLVESSLKWPLVNEAVEESLKAISKPKQTEDQDSKDTAFVNQPPRSITRGEDASKLLLTMPGYVGNYKLNGRLQHTMACKVVTSFSANSEREPPLPSILANILLFNTTTGQLAAVLEGTKITAWRTAAASIVATKYLYFKRYPEEVSKRSVKVAIIGCGVQGESHALGMIATFNVADIYLWNRTQSKAVALAELLRGLQGFKGNVHVSANAAEACSDVDIVCVGTYSPTALVTRAMLKKADVHINTVGAGQIHFGEVAPDIYDVGKVYVDSWVNARNELKDLKAEIVAEVGEVINSEKYPPKEGITIFQSMGIAAADATVAQAVYNALNIESLKNN